MWHMVLSDAGDTKNLPTLESGVVLQYSSNEFGVLVLECCGLSAVLCPGVPGTRRTMHDTVPGTSIYGTTVPTKQRGTSDTKCVT